MNHKSAYNRCVARPELAQRFHVARLFNTVETEQTKETP